jgi:hypothetical protein
LERHLAEIKTINGFVVQVDDRDLDLAATYRWTAHLMQRRGCVRPIAVIGWKPGDSYQMARLHRLLMGAKKGEIVDHIDGDPLNNRRSNLRICTIAENARNRKSGLTKSGYKGVSRHSTRQRAKPWRAKIMAEGKEYKLGHFETSQEAHAAYVEAARRLHGAFANPG